MAARKDYQEKASKQVLKQALPSTVDINKLLTVEERAKITAAASLKIVARDKLDAEEAFLNNELARIDGEAHPEKVEEMREIWIDLALYADRIILDGVQYFHGTKYTVPKSKYDTMQEIMSKTRRHDEEIHSGEAGDNYYRKERAMRVNMLTGAASIGGQPVRF
jgi:hypothetical protein